MTVQAMVGGSRERIEQELVAIIESGDADRLDHLASAVRGNPHYPDMRFRLAHAYHVRGEDEAALAELDAALGLNPDFDDAIQLKAAILASQGRLEAALECYEAVLARRPAEADCLYRAAVVLARLGRHAEACDRALFAVEHQPNHELAHALLAEQFLHEQDWARAYGHYQAANRIRPSEDYSYMLALLALREGDHAKAQQWLEQALELRPSHLNSAVRLAVLKVQAGNYERAYGLLRLALQHYPNYPDLHYSLARICLLMGRRDEAHDLMQSALELNPRYAEVRREMGFLLQSRHMDQEAADQLRQSLEINPDDEQAYVNLGLMYSDHGEHDRAVLVLEQAIRRFPESWRLHHSLGIVHLQEKAFPKARLSFRNAIRINPELESTQRSLRIVFRDESLLEEERERLLGRYKDQPSGELDFRLGLLHLDFHKDKQAINHLQRAFTAGHLPVTTGLLLGTVNANVQNFDSAIRTVSELRASGLEEAIRRLLCALLYANTGDHDRSARFYQQVMTEMPLFFHSLGGIGICFREREELDDMLDDYLDYARYHERNARLFCRIGEIHASKALLVEARRHFHHAIVLDSHEAKGYHALGVLSLFRLDYSVAVDFFLRACTERPDWSLPHLSLATLYQALDRPELAEPAFREFIRAEPPGTWRDMASKAWEKLTLAAKS